MIGQSEIISSVLCHIANRPLSPPGSKTEKTAVITPCFPSHMAAPYIPKTKPYSYQATNFDETKDLKYFGYWWEMGCGKTKPTIDAIGHQFRMGMVNSAMILAPKSVAPNWVNDELPAHMGLDPDEYVVFLWNTSKAGNKGYQNPVGVRRPFS